MDDNNQNQQPSQSPQEAQQTPSASMQPPVSTQPPTQQPVQPATPASGDEEITVGKYKIKVLRDACIGAASCVAVAAQTFKLDEQNKAVVLPGSQDPSETILMAAQSCPTKAIVVIDTETNQQVWPA